MEDVYDQPKQNILADAKASIKQQAFYMKRAIASDNLKETFKFSAALLSELRTSLLSPKQYYDLYIRALEELREIEVFFEESRGRGHNAQTLYELVQHAGNVLPRLYLLLTVGAVYIRSGQAPVKAILKDMVEMCCGIQHPVRGLFIRSYLTQISKEGLALMESSDADSQNDAVEFLLQNFTEMNKLWVRMQHQGPARERSKREQERKELRDLVAKNLVMLSHFEGVDEKLYGEIVLPRILEQVIGCKDELAQNYLMDCIIQVFPDEFHIQNLEALLESCGNLHPNTDVSSIMCGLIKRLAKYLETNPESIAEFNEKGAFEKLLEPISKISGSLDQASVASVYGALLDFTVRQKSKTLDRVDTVLAQCAEALQGINGGSGSLKHRQAAKALRGILTTPLESYDITELLELGSYPDVMHLLDYPSQKQVAMDIVQKVLDAGTVISEKARVESLLDFISMLLEDQQDTAQNVEQNDNNVDLDDEDIEEEQNLVARLVHQLKSEDVQQNFEILELVRDRFSHRGGPLRLKHSLPPIVFDTLQLIKREDEAERQIKMFQFLQGTIDMIAEIPQPEKAFQLYLECALVADARRLEDNAYEFITAAFDVFENSIPDRKAQVEALALLIGTLNECTHFGEDNWDTLVTSATKWSIKLLKKSDQCKSVYACSHLFWRTNEDGSVQQGEKLLVCLKKALTIAKQAQGIAKTARGDVGPVELFISILNKYLYFFGQQSSDIVINAEDVQNLLDLVSNETSSLGSDNDSVLRYYHNTLRHLMHLKEKKAEKYADISLNN